MIREIGIIQLFYVLSLILLIVCSVMIGSVIYSNDYLSAEYQFAADSFSIISAAVSIFMGMKWLKMKKFEAAVKNVDLKLSLHAFCMWSLLRLGLLSILFLINVILYYSFQGMNIQMYCMIIIYAVFVLCRPSWSVFDAIRLDN